MQAQHHRRKECVIERTTLILGGQRAERQRAGTAGHRRALVGRLDLHVAAEERPVDQVIGAGCVRQLGRQLGVDRRAVQALVVILQDQFPIGAHVVFDAAHGAHGREIVVHESSHQRREPLLGRYRRGVEIHEQKPFPLRERHAVQRVRLLVESFHFIHVRRADQTPIERVRPRVVGALDRFRETAVRGFTQAGAAMAADVVVRSGVGRLIAQHDDALARDADQEVIARAGERCFAADADPLMPEHPLLFLREHLG